MELKNIENIDALKDFAPVKFLLIFMETEKK